MKIHLYILTLSHDGGTRNITTSGSSPKAAIHKVMMAEGCPRCAITSIKRAETHQD